VKGIDAQSYERVADGAETDGDADEIAAKQGGFKGRSGVNVRGGRGYVMGKRREQALAAGQVVRGLGFG